MRWSRVLSYLGLGLCLPASGLADPTHAPAALDRFEFGEPIVFHNMTIVPVSSTHPGPFARYTLLEAGLKKKTLRVRELNGQSNQAQVSAVQIRNTGAFAAFVLSGEMILGGKQDRILSSDTVVPNDGKWHEVEVFCVEQGRWQGKKMKFDEGSAMAHAQLRKAALSGSQGEVWAEVERKNSTHGTSNATQTYRRTVQNAQLRKRVAKHRAQIARRLPDQPISGFIFAINGEMRVADMFTNPLLFQDLQEKLLSAYILEALEHQIDASAPKFDKKGAKRFYDSAKEAPEVSSKVSGRSRSYKKKKKGVVGTKTVDEETGQTIKESYLKD